MEEQFYVDRCKLRELWLEHPEWSKRKFAEALGRSESWVKKWLRRIRKRPLADAQVLKGLSRARKRPPERIAREVVERILEIRDYPPQDLGRSPGPLAILYYLQKDESLTQAGVRLPRSSRTIWEILDRHGRIAHRRPGQHEPEERPSPGVEWGMDFQDVSSVPAEAEGKRMHVVEILNWVDHGTSEVVASIPREDYTAETALRELAGVLLEHGCPDRIRLDRDPRWVGSWTAKDFPAPVLRFLLCLGIQPKLCPPQRPDKNPFVERYHRNFKYECQRIFLPTDLAQTEQVNAHYVHFYNFERPNQAITCSNLPPRVKFPQAPPLLPVPDPVDPDRWVLTLQGKTYKRRLDPNGRFRLGSQSYYVGKNWRGSHVLITVDGPQRMLSIHSKQQVLKKMPIKGLHNQMMSFAQFLEWISRQAVSTRQHTSKPTPTYGRGHDVGKQRRVSM